jgi:hypothetical protein
VCIDARANDVWDSLKGVEDITLWSEAVRAAEWRWGGIARSPGRIGPSPSPGLKLSNRAHRLGEAGDRGSRARAFHRAKRHDERTISLGCAVALRDGRARLRRHG